MKCPKCGFIGFDYLDACKKCGTDLKDHKSKFGIRSLVFALGGGGAAADAAEVRGGEESPGDPMADGTDFGFDFMSDEEPAAGEGVSAELLDDTEEEGFLLGEEGEEDPFAAAAGPSVDAEEGFDFDVEEIPETDESPTDLGDDDLLGDWDDEPGEEPLLEDQGQGGDEKSPFETRRTERGDLFSGWDESPAPVLASAEAEFEAVETVAAEDSQALIGMSGDTSPFSVEEPSGGEDVLADDHRVFTVAPDQAPVDEMEGRFSYSPGISEQEGFHSAWQDSDAESLPEPSASGGRSNPRLISRRLIASLSDLAIVACAFVLFLGSAELLLGRSGDGLPIPRLDTFAALAVPYFLVLFALCFGYFTLFHYLLGQTPGKMLMGLRVESASGRELLFSQAFLRSVGGLMSLLPCGAGYLVVLLGREGCGWNDRLAGTRVVPDSSIGDEGAVAIGGAAGW